MPHDDAPNADKKNHAHDHTHDHEGTCGSSCGHTHENDTSAGLGLAGKMRDIAAGAQESNPPHGHEGHVCSSKSDNTPIEHHHGHNHNHSENPAHGEPGHICGGGHDHDHDHNHDNPEDYATDAIGYLISNTNPDAESWIGRNKGTAMLGASAILGAAEHHVTGAPTISALTAIYGGTVAANENIDGAKDYLMRHRSKVALGAAATMSAIEYHTTGTQSLSSSLAMIFGASVVALDSAQHMTKAFGDLEQSHNAPGAIVAGGVTAAHQVQEGLYTVMAPLSGAGSEELAIASITGGQPTHNWLFAGLVGLAGSLNIEENYAYKMTATFMAASTAAYGYQIATNNFDPVISTGMVGGTLLFQAWRVSAGETCILHGDTCGHARLGPKNTTDYVSFPYGKKILGNIAELAKQIKDTDYSDAFTDLSLRVATTKPKLPTIPTRKQISTKLQKIGKSLTHHNVVTLGASIAAASTSAHIVGTNMVQLAEQGGVAQAAAGSIIIPVAWALPEIVAGVTAAWKGRGDIAGGMIVGCSITNTGLIGGLQGWLGFEVAPNVSLETTSGQWMMGGLIASAASYVTFMNPAVGKKMAKIDNAIANIAPDESKWQKFWQNDEEKPHFSKLAATASLAAAGTYYAVGGQPNCHWDWNMDIGEAVPHCIESVKESAEPAAVTFGL